MLKKTFGELINILTGSILIICLLMAGYLMFANVYHMRELNVTYRINETEIINQQTYVKEVDEYYNKISNMDFEKFGQTEKKVYYQVIKEYLTRCLGDLKATTYYSPLIETNAITNYSLSESFTTKVYGSCLRGTLMEINTVRETNSHQDLELNLHMKDFDQVIMTINQSNELSKKILIGNSRYYFTTADTRLALYDENKIVYSSIAENHKLSLLITKTLVDHLETVANGEV